LFNPADHFLSGEQPLLAANTKLIPGGLASLNRNADPVIASLKKLMNRCRMCMASWNGWRSDSLRGDGNYLPATASRQYNLGGRQCQLCLFCGS